MFKKEKVGKDIQENLRVLLKKLEFERDILIDKVREDLGILPTDLFYFAVGALFDVFPDMKKNKEIIGYYNRAKKFKEVFLLVFPDSGGTRTEEYYMTRLNNFKVAVLEFTKEINAVKKELESGKWSK